MAKPDNPPTPKRPTTPDPSIREVAVALAPPSEPRVGKDPVDYKQVAEAYENIRQATRAVENACHDTKVVFSAMTSRFVPVLVPHYLSLRDVEKGYLETGMTQRFSKWMRANVPIQDITEYLRTEQNRHRCLEAQAAARLHFGRVSRPGLRPLTLLDMPTEILVQIVEWGQLGDEESGSESVRACRLTCRWLSSIADNFLIPGGTVRLSLDNESLSRLESISRHPTIRNTVKTVELDLSLFPHEDVPLSVFASHATCLLNLALGKYDPNSAEFMAQEHWPDCICNEIPRIHEDVGLIHDACKFLRNYAEAPGVNAASEWTAMIEHGLQHSKDCEWAEMEPLVAGLVKQAEIYRGLFREQDLLLRNEFFSRLLGALKQMSRLDAIRFTEWDFNRIEVAPAEPPLSALWKKGLNKGTVRFPFEAFSQNPHQPAIDILAQSKFLLKPLPMSRIPDGPHHLFSFMAQLMATLTRGKLSHVVKNIEIGLWGSGCAETTFNYRPRGLAGTYLTFGTEADLTSPVYAAHMRQIRQATENLESFSLNTVCQNLGVSTCPCPQARLTMLLSPFLQAPGLRRLNIHHAGDASGYPRQPHHVNTGGPFCLGPPPVFEEYRGYVGRGLAMRASPFLCDITLKGVILHQTDFQKFLRHGLERPLHQLRLEDVGLQTGSWRTMLVFLRRLKSSQSSLPKVLRGMRGAEVRWALTRRRSVRRLLGPDYGPQAVSDFINGHSDDDANPFVKLEELGAEDIRQYLREHDEKVLAKEARDSEPHDHDGDEFEDLVPEEEEEETDEELDDLELTGSDNDMVLD
ncbi:hypothetical protein QBC39DRAFT_397198 [Podospora conica]|nr:hypothetical protein QBC39DRAFT_397198 [Schizothecium conicum]